MTNFSVNIFAVLLAIVAWGVSDAAPKNACAAGTVPVIRVIYKGRVSSNEHQLYPAKQFPNIGITAEEKIFAPAGYFKSIFSGNKVKPVPEGTGGIPWAGLYLREVPFEKVKINTPTEAFEYDARSDKPGKLTEHPSLASGGLNKKLQSFFMEGLSSAAQRMSTIGAAKYADVPCTEYAFTSELAGNVNGRACVAELQGLKIVLAEDWIDKASGEPQSMRATKVDVDVCMSLDEFRPAPGVSFKHRSSRPKFSDEADSAGDEQ